MDAFKREGAKVDIGSFSPQLLQAIRDLEQAGLKHETDLEYLRRTRPDLTEAQRLNLMFFSMILGKSVRQQPSQEDIV